MCSNRNTPANSPASETINATSILPLNLPRRPYHPYTTGYVHYLRDPYLRPLLHAAGSPHNRMLNVATASDDGVAGGCLDLMPLRKEEKAIQDTSTVEDSVPSFSENN
mgnify:FL=1